MDSPADSPRTPAPASVPAPRQPSYPPLPGPARLAVVTGASSGIGAATARALAASGFRVVCTARRADRLEALAAEIGGVAVACDVTDEASVAALAERVAAEVGAAGLPGLHVLVNNAGGAFGADPVAAADPAQWRAMWEVNVLGLMLVTRALLPSLRASGDGLVVTMGSTAGRVAYEGGGGYTAAKHGAQVVTETLRLELCGEPVRVTEVAPGMVMTDEFSLTRFGGDAEAAMRVYDGVPDPLVAEDVADVVAWVATRPAHVNVDEVVVRPRAQAAQHKVHRVR